MLYLYNMLSRLLYILIGVFISLVVIAQEDTEFWFVAPDVSGNHGDRPIHLVVTSLAFETYVQITMPANGEFETIGINLPPNTTRLIDLSQRVNQIENVIYTSSNTYDPFSNKGIRIRATAPIKAYYEVSSPRNPDMFSLKGKNALGTHFFTIFQQERNNARKYKGQAYSGFHLVAVEDNTKIQIKPTADLIAREGFYPKGKVFTITLNRGETFVGVPAKFEDGLLVISQEGSDHPSGTEVMATKPIAMTLHDCSVEGIVHTSARDLRGDQNIPVNMLGKEYIVMQGQGRVCDDGQLIDEEVHILAVADNEKIYINGHYVTTLNKGEKHILQVRQPYMHIRSEDSVVYVMQISGEAELGKAILPTTSDCTGSFEVAFTRTGQGSIFLNIMVIKGAEDDFLFNGAPAHWLDSSLFQPVPGDDRWVALKTEDVRDYISIGENSVITNTKDLFHLGLINTNQAGTKFGYFSNFNDFSTSVINTTNGQDYLHACYGKPVTFLSTSGMSEYNSGGLKYLWSTGDTTFSIQVDPSTDSTFYVTVTLDNECNMTAVDSGSMTVSGPIFPQAFPEDTLVCIYDSVLLHAEGSDRFFWSNGMKGDSITIRPGKSQTYHVSVTDNYGCYELDSVYVEVHPIPDLVLPDLIEDCEGEQVVLDTELNPSFDLIWENGDTNMVRTVTETGKYSFFVLGEADCMVPDTVEVVFYEHPDYELTNDTIKCPDRYMVLKISGGTAHQWNYNNLTFPTIYVSPSNPKTYYVSVYNHGCEVVDSVHVDIYDQEPEILSSTGSFDVCQGDSVELSVNYGNDFLWFNGETTQSIMIHSHISQRYGVSVIDTNNCKNYLSRQLDVHESPETYLKGETIVACLGDTAKVEEKYKADYIYQWSNGTSSHKLATLDSGLFYVSVTSEVGCMSKDSIFIDRRSYPYAEISSDTIVCSGDELQLSAYFDPSYTYSWSSGHETHQIDVIVEQDTSYVVSVYDPYYCMASDTVYVSVEPNPPSRIIEGDDTVYIDEDFSMYHISETSENKYMWFLSDAYDTAVMPHGNTGSSVIIDWRTVDSDIYRLSVIEKTPLANCSTENEKEIYVASLPVIEIVMMPVSCFDDANDGKAEASVSNGIPPFSYVWSNGENTNTFQRQHEITSLHEGVYEITVSDYYGKQAFDSVFIDKRSYPYVETSNDTIVCSGDELQLSAYFDSSYTYSWSSGYETHQIDVIAEQDTSYIVSVYDSYYCMASDTVYVSVEPNPPSRIIEGDDTVYINEDFSMYHVSETPENKYMWFLSDAYDTAVMPYGNTGASVIIDWRTVDSDIYSLSVIEKTPLTNCSTENEKEIYVASLPVIEISTMPISCFNANDGKAEASVSNGIPPFSYVWSNGEYTNTFQRQHEITSLHEGVYGVTVSDHYGKQVFASVFLENPPDLFIEEVRKQHIRCYNRADGTLHIIPEGGTPEYDFYWQHTNNTNAYQAGLSTGTYYVTVYDHNHCTVDTAITLNEPELLIVKYDIVHPYCPVSEDGKIRLSVHGGNPFDDGGEPYYSYNWSVPSDANADSLDGLNPGVYFYTVTDKSGCHVSDSVLLIADQDICIDIPSAFTPNGDGVNDTWEIRYIDAYYPNAKMEIFDRYGRLVYLSSRGYIPWDGRKKGKFVPVDSYYYVLTFVDTEGYTTGIVTVIY